MDALTVINQIKVSRKLVAMATAAVVAFVALRGIVWVQTVRKDPDLPPAPTGPSVTWSDWADWSSMAVGLKPTPNQTPRLGGDSEY